jgi:hypothetical protein
MEDEISINLQELTNLFVACPNGECAAEIGFDLTKRLFARAVNCPVCGANVLEVNRQERFEFTWAVFVKKLLDAEGKPRMFFRMPRAGR